MESIIESWPNPAPMMIHFRLAQGMPGIPDVLRSLSESLAKEVKSVVPVADPTVSDAYVIAARDVARIHGRGAAIRIPAVFAGDPQRVADVVDSLVSKLALQPSDLDLLLDFESFDPTHEAAIVTATCAVIARLPRVIEWRSLTVLSSSFPVTLSGVKAKTIKMIPRSEWQLWKRITEQRPERMPRFGDYGIEHPSLRVFDPKKMTVAAGLRYTIKDAWLVFKGHATKTHGNEQFISFCQRLVEMHEYYSGEHFSWGDAQIMATARGLSGPGNPTTWREIGTNHHVKFVIESLSTLSDF